MMVYESKNGLKNICEKNSEILYYETAIHFSKYRKWNL